MDAFFINLQQKKREKKCTLMLEESKFEYGLTCTLCSHIALEIACGSKH